MPRKKKTEAEATEVKTTKKRVAKKEKTNLLKSEFTISDMVSWTDEECEAKEKEFQFKIADLRDVFKSLLNVSTDLETANKNLNLLKDTLTKGLMTGYRVVCPHCKREYVVSSMELNREGNVTCKICGTEYKEDEHIEGIAMVANESVSDIIKDNEMVTI